MIEAGVVGHGDYTADERVRPHRTGANDHHACHCGHTHSEVESEEEEDDRNGPLPSSPSYQYSRHATGKPVAGVTGAYRKPGSPASSVDGYESFENTNNKKKRKIPNMGSNGSHHASLSADLTGMGIAQAHEAGATDDGDDLARDGQNGECWPIRPISPTPKRTANVRCHLGN